EDITDVIELQDLAVPIPFDPSTREGQLILTIASQGSRVDQILHPSSNRPLLPDPAFVVPSSVATPTLPAKRRLRPPSPDFDQPSLAPSSPAAVKPRRPRQPFPISPEPIAMATDLSPEPQGAPEVPEVLVTRPSFARAAKANPKIPEVFRKASVPGSKRDRSPIETKPAQPLPDPPAKRRRTQKPTEKTPTDSLALPFDDSRASPVEAPLRIQDGPPDYFHGDDTKVSAHQYFLTNPRFQPKTPFSELIRKTTDANKRGYKPPFLRPPKWNVSDELKDFGAFANIGDTSFSLQGLSRFGYASSR
ncbi:hypothetical protein EV361DRAFT_957317, partial [Lentinula raphanica]